MPNRKVLLTGASGYIASQILPSFQDQYDMALVDVNDSDRQGFKMPGVEITDLGDPDLLSIPITLKTWTPWCTWGTSAAKSRFWTIITTSSSTSAWLSMYTVRLTNPAPGGS